MLIRQEQMVALEQVALRTFEDLMVGHLRTFAPKHSQLMGEPAVRQVIRLGVERAARYGFTNRGPVRFYIELMYLLGSDFDTDPLFPWAGTLLRNGLPPDQMARADWLHERAMDYFAKAMGPDQVHEKEAIRRLDRESFERVPSVFDAQAECVRRLRRIFPQKCDYVGEAALGELVPRALDRARAYGVLTGAGVALFIGLMFAFGHGCAADPQFPWIGSVLQNPVAGDADRRVERVRTRMVNYLKAGLEGT